MPPRPSHPSHGGGGDRQRRPSTHTLARANAARNVKVGFGPGEEDRRWPCLGVVLRKVLSACSGLCYLCPSLRTCSRLAVKCYKKILADIFPATQVQKLIAELNEILTHDVVDEAVVWKNNLEPESKQLFDFLPPSIQEWLLLERDPYGNVQVAKIETEKMLITMVEMELEKRKVEGKYKGHFIGQSHFFGYEGRCSLPTNIDASYCYALGYGVGALLQSGKTCLISSIGNLVAPVTEWTVGGTALTSLMDVERR